jgi:thiol-disulfide isomerase/thioredoxin
MIDKNVPLKFVSDKDERLVQNGEMIAAQNVTITQRGEGGESIVKTAKGWKVINEKTGTAQETEVTLVGSVTVEETNKLYMWFATTAGDGHGEDRIVEYDVTTNKWENVFKSTWLNLDVNAFVSANAIVKAFQQDGVTKTMLYWTDNDNPPRKINVARAKAGDFDDIGDVQRDYALTVIKGAPVVPPTFNFVTNTNYQLNNFERTTIQFAVQWIYKDGEISAIGPYSKLAFPDHISASGLEGDQSGQLFFTDNQCNIDTRKFVTALNFPTEVSKVRLLGSKDNGTSAFIIDEFDPNEDLERSIMGTVDKVYDKDTGVYKFLNDEVYQSLGNEDLNKLFDNVPLKAEAQTIVGNRLMYANYEEGRPNVPTKVTLTPKYSDEVQGGSILIADDDTSIHSENTSERLNDAAAFFTEIDFVDSSYFSATSDTVPGGTLFETSIVLKPKGSLSNGTAVADFNSSNYFLTGSVSDGTNSFQVGIGHLNDVDTHLDIPATTTPFTFQTSVSAPEDMTLGDFTNEFFEQVSAFFTNFTLSYDISSSASGFNTLAEVYSGGGAGGVSNGDKLPVNGTFTITWKFKITHPTTTSVRISPYVSNVKPTSVTIGVQGQDFATGDFGTSTNQASWSVSSGFSDQKISDQGVGLDVSGATTRSMRTFAAAKTFKSGCSHELGIVYYDKYNRSGFVNKLGSFYAESPAERTGGNRGAVSVKITWDSGFVAPTWATRYQIVYGGMSSYDSYIQYTTGRAFVPRLHTGNVDSNQKQIYVKLDTIDNYRSKKGAVIDYSFTEGDKLRVIKYSTNGNTSQSDLGYVIANDNKTLVEFNVVGVVELTDTLGQNPIANIDQTNANLSIDQKFTGKFIILEAPQVAAGIQSQDTSTQELKYPGWDWFSVAHDADGSVVYPDGSDPAQTSLWGHNSVVEILTPSTSENKVYYEIGESHQLGARKDASNIVYPTVHGPNITITDGDSYLRTSAVNTPKYESNAFVVDDRPKHYVFKNVELESQSVSDFFSSKKWSRGRAHTTFENAATVNRYNSITYSDAYVDEVSKLSLSSFNLSLGNFFDLPSENGACRSIKPMLDKLVALQENKVSLVGVNKGVIETGSQDGFVTLSTNVLQNIIPFGADYGTKNPESVFIRDGALYFGDASRQAIVKATMQGLNVISDQDIKSRVESEFESWTAQNGDKMFSGYDPEDNIYYFTLFPKGTYTGFTVSWDNKRRVWGSTHTFYGHGYASIKNQMIAGKYNSALDTIASRLDDDSVLSLNSTYQESNVTIVANDNPSMVKTYESVSTESDDEWGVSLVSSRGQTTGALTMVEKEDAFYGMVTGDTSSNSTAQYILVGKVSEVDGDVITINGNLKGITIPKGYSIFKFSSGAYVTLNKTVVSVDRSTKKITSSSGGDAFTVGDHIFVATTGQNTGDQIRGHYCKITAAYTPSSTTDKSELYSINAKYAQSKANHSGA